MRIFWRCNCALIKLQHCTRMKPTQVLLVLLTAVTAARMCWTPLHCAKLNKLTNHEPNHHR